MPCNQFPHGTHIVHKEDLTRVWLVKVDTDDGIAIEADNGAIRYVLPKEYEDYSVHTPEPRN